MDEEWITIGELAGRTRLSVKALRLYGERGLLVPGEVDGRSGVRRYGDEQVERARRIALLRAVGMPLARIGDVLDAGGGEEAVRLFDVYWREQEAVHAARREAVRHAREVLAGGGLRACTGSVSAMCRSRRWCSPGAMWTPGRCPASSPRRASCSSPGCAGRAPISPGRSSRSTTPW
ncbi:MerR family transcriptional regulator [Streptomyces sp. SBR177]